MAATQTQPLESQYPERYGSFKRSAGPVSLQESYNQPHTVTKWTSEKTGLRVVLIDVEGPLCNLFGSVATEIFDDSGCPHTLEHLVFLGSEQYPYKGILDTLANRAFAAGTNAWTDTTNTTYTITTAGEEGFLRILPVYMDHVLYPTLKDTGFTTEVYHVNGKGEDAGVVYSEMQGVENESYQRMALKMQRSLYPEGSAYRSETGGLMGALRVLDIDKIRKYHSSYYLPQNVCLFITGKIDATKLLRALTEEVEPTIEKHNQALGPRPAGWKRPWIDTPSATAPVLNNNKVETIEFPEKDETMGEISINWVGPSYSDFLTEKALDVLNSYLGESAVSPLQRELIEIAEPWATGIGFQALEHSTAVLTLSASSVPTEKLDSIQQEITNVLKGVLKQGVDMQRMSMILNREQRKLLNTLESDAGDALTYALLTDFLFGAEDSSQLSDSLNDIKRFKTLQNWTAADWANLLEKYYLARPALTIIGKPSAKLAATLRKETKERVSDRRKKLGEDGLRDLQDKLDAAQKANDVEAPLEVIEKFKIPDVESIRWITVETAGAGSNTTRFDSAVQRHIDQDNADLPYFLQFEHVKSNFLEIAIYLDAAKLSNHRDLITLYLNVFHSLPLILEDGTKMSFEEVVNSLDTETVEYDISFGAGLSEQIKVSIKVEKDKYEQAVRWMKNLLFCSEFDVERLRITAQRLLQNLPSEKRDGLDVALAAYRSLVLDKDQSTSVSQQLLARLESTPAVVERLKTDPEGVVAGLKELGDNLTSSSGMRINVTGDILNLQSPVTTWKEHFAKFPANKLAPVTFGKDCLSDLGRKPSRTVTLAPMPTIESSYGYFVAKGPDTYDHPDLPALTIAKTALNALEGLLWRSVRGAGLAYGANIYTDVERGFTYYNIYRSPDSAKAYIESKKAIEAMIAGTLMPLDQMRLDGAKSELAYYTANSQSSLSKAANASFTNQALLGIPQSYQRDLLAKAKNVTLEQANEAVKKYILPIFDATTSIAAIATSKGKSSEIRGQLEAIGFNVTLLDISNSDEDSGSESGSGSDSEGSEDETESQSEASGSTESWQVEDADDASMQR